MGRKISTYDNDSNLTRDDRLLGTTAGSDATVNFPLDRVSAFVRETLLPEREDGTVFIQEGSGLLESFITNTVTTSQLNNAYTALDISLDLTKAIYLTAANVITIGSAVTGVFTDPLLENGRRIILQNTPNGDRTVNEVMSFDSVNRTITLVDNISDAGAYSASTLQTSNNFLTLVRNDGVNIEGTITGNFTIPSVTFGDQANEVATWAEGNNADELPISKIPAIDYTGTKLINTPRTITTGEVTKLGHINVTAATDLDTLRSNVATNNSKASITLTVSNATDLAEVSDGTTTIEVPVGSVGVGSVLPGDATWTGTEPKAGDLFYLTRPYLTFNPGIFYYTGTDGRVGGWAAGTADFEITQAGVQTAITNPQGFRTHIDAPGLTGDNTFRGNIAIESASRGTYDIGSSGGFAGQTSFTLTDATGVEMGDTFTLHGTLHTITNVAGNVITFSPATSALTVNNTMINIFGPVGDITIDKTIPQTTADSTVANAGFVRATPARQVVNQNDLTTPLFIWEGTEAEYEAILNDPNRATNFPDFDNTLYFRR